MSLGINRDMPGDIPAGNNSAVHVCLDSVTGFIINELDRIRHTAVRCRLIDEIPDMARPEMRTEEIIVASERIEVLIPEHVMIRSRLYKLRLFR